MPNDEKTQEQNSISQQQDDQALSLGGRGTSLTEIRSQAKKVVSDGKISDPEIRKELSNQNVNESEKAEASEAEGEGESESNDQAGGQEQSLVSSKKIKIGDRELTEEDLVEAVKALENKSAWQKNLTMRSQIAAALPDGDELNAVHAMAMKKREIPENITEIALKESKLPETIEIMDEEGDAVTIKTSSLPKELLSALASNAFNAVWPDLVKQRQEIAEKSKDVDEQMRKIGIWQEVEITKEATSFMKEHPDYAIQLGPGESFRNTLASILSSGEIHPELPRAMKIYSLLQYRQKNGGSFEEAYEAFEGPVNAKKKVVDKIKKNQQDDIPTEKGMENVVKTKAQQKLDRLRDPRNAEILKVFS